VAISGHLVSGAPQTLCEAIMQIDLKDLTIIHVGCDFTGKGIGKLIEGHRIKKCITSHIGTLPAAQEQYKSGELEVEFVPIGTLMTRLYCGGGGLGGALTPTGVGTEVAEGKQEMVINGKTYLLELPLRAQVALIYADVVDKMGNARCRYTQRNVNPVFASAADLVICEAKQIVEVGELDPDDIHIPGVLIDYVVQK
jgi:acetate CoA/acetoacetate CoA-transferase alpha subunit